MRKRNLRKKEKWLKKAVAALCLAVLLVGLAEGADSLSVQAVGDTKNIIFTVSFLGETSFSEDVEKAAEAFKDANDLTVTDDNGMEYHCTDKEYDATDLSKIKYKVAVPKDKTSLAYKFSSQDQAIDCTCDDISGSDCYMSIVYVGCYFMDGDNLLSSSYIPTNQIVLQEPSAPSKSGHVFEGWVTSKDGNTSFNFNQVIKGVTKIYASWQDWELTADGNLTISSQDGMDDWNTNGAAAEGGKVKTATINAAVTVIPADAFRNCSNVEKVYMGGAAPKVGSKAFDDCKFIRDSKKGIVVPAGSANTYKTAWPEYKCYITESNTDEDAHDYGTEWGSDDTGHWPVCSTCKNEKTGGKAAHTENNGTVTQEPTETEEGIRTYHCSVCGYEMRTEPIPTLTPSMDIAKEVKTVGDVPRTDLLTSEEELAKAVLTDEEMKKAEGGTDITIRVTVKDGDDTVSDKEKELVSGKSEGYQVGKYLDISMIKKIGADEIQVEKLPNGSVQLKFQVPDDLKNTNLTKVRKFRVIRVHNDAATVLEDLDDSENTVTIETSRFSTYALAYQDVDRTDEDNNDPGNNTNNNNSNNNNTNTGTGGNTNTGNTNTGNTNTSNTNTRNSNTGGTAGTGSNTTTAAAGSTNTGTTGTAGTTTTGTSNQARGNALRTGDVAPVGFYTVIALCFLGIMMVLERKQQSGGTSMMRRMPRPY